MTISLAEARARFLTDLVARAIGAPANIEEELQALDLLNRLLPASIGYEEDRTELHRKLIASSLARRAGNGRRAFFLIGPPGAGKSTFALELAKSHRALIIDCDEFKERLPEYLGGKLAGHVHEESGRLARNAFFSAVQQGKSIVLPMVGSSSAKIEGMRRGMTSRGYKCSLWLVDAAAEVCLERCRKRYLETGRFVPESYVLRVAALPRLAFQELQSAEWEECRDVYASSGDAE